MIPETLIKETCHWGWLTTVQRFSPLSSQGMRWCVEHCSMQAGRVLERSLEFYLWVCKQLEEIVILGVA